jgi:hypothetical protein
MCGPKKPVVIGPAHCAAQKRGAQSAQPPQKWPKNRVTTGRTLCGTYLLRTHSTPWWSERPRCVRASAHSKRRSPKCARRELVRGCPDEEQEEATEDDRDQVGAVSHQSLISKPASSQAWSQSGRTDRRSARLIPPGSSGKSGSHSRWKLQQKISSGWLN